MSTRISVVDAWVSEFVGDRPDIGVVERRFVRNTWRFCAEDRSGGVDCRLG